MIHHVQLNFLIMGGIDNYWPFNYLSHFADTCEIISQPDHPFNSYDQKSKWSIVYISLDGAD